MPTIRPGIGKAEGQIASEAEAYLETAMRSEPDSTLCHAVQAVISGTRLLDLTWLKLVRTAVVDAGEGITEVVG
ncbi:hypothetical protein GCM10010178_36620 [Lentzea flava]|uniref:Uncharacterized protein n=1 Tax=Lentzea flava TaxID=103732 RepID=A0ABQ2UJW4_9PSEU|nr:hypothetical protein [Lentzea flava]GGU40803.1 hypothetical protein GCM10010178_36620 [Lentzea flava]